jgi:hypothetical protein
LGRPFGPNWKARYAGMLIVLKADDAKEPVVARAIKPR